MRAGVRADRQRLIAQAVPVVEQQHVGAAELAHLGRRGPARERMGARRRQHERIAPDRLALEIAEIGLQRQQRPLERPLLDRPHQHVGLLFRPANDQPRLRAAERRHDPRQEIGRDRGDDAEPQPGRARIAEAPGGVGEIVGLRQQTPRAGDDLLARRGRQHAAAVALEQAHAERRLELGQLRAQRRLRHAAERGRLAKAARAGHRDRVLQLPGGEGMRGQPLRRHR